MTFLTYGVSLALGSPEACRQQRFLAAEGDGEAPGIEPCRAIKVPRPQDGTSVAMLPRLIGSRGRGPHIVLMLAFLPRERALKVIPEHVR